jgi:hypothetical protein
LCNREKKWHELLTTWFFLLLNLKSQRFVLFCPLFFFFFTHGSFLLFSKRSPPPQLFQPVVADPPKDKVTILRELRERNIISEEEFQQRLARLNPPKPAALQVVSVERRMSDAPPPVPEFPGIEAFGLAQEEMLSSFDQIMMRPHYDAGSGAKEGG